jgi:hypothetical protein
LPPNDIDEWAAAVLTSAGAYGPPSFHAVTRSGTPPRAAKPASSGQISASARSSGPSVTNMNRDYLSPHSATCTRRRPVHEAHLDMAEVDLRGLAGHPLDPHHHVGGQRRPRHADQALHRGPPMAVARLPHAPVHLARRQTGRVVRHSCRMVVPNSPGYIDFRILSG